MMTGAGHKYLYTIKLQAVHALLWLSLSLASLPLLADSPRTAILFPEIREPFRSVFTTITDGISETIPGETAIRPIRDDDDIDSLQNWLHQQQAGVTVVLGSRGEMIGKDLAASTPIVIGAVHMSDDLRNEPYYGIALNPDPATMFHRLKALAPDVRQVNIIYHRDREQWLINESTRIADEFGLTLNALPVDRLQEAAGKYREVMATQKSGSEALWLSQDTNVLDEQAVLPMILKEAWDRRLIVFSSNPSHARRGVLFALYPDNHRMGQSLGALALKVHQHLSHAGPAVNPGMRMLKDLQIAFNVRTAGRLGIRYTRDDLANFDLIFPPQ